MHSLHGKDGNTEWAAHFNGVAGGPDVVVLTEDGEARAFSVGDRGAGTGARSLCPSCGGG